MIQVYLNYFLFLLVKNSFHRYTSLYCPATTYVVSTLARLILRNSHRRCSLKKGVPKSFAVSTGKQLCWSLFSINLQALKVLNLLHRTPLEDCFEYLQIFIFAISIFVSRYLTGYQNFIFEVKK